jgi:nitroreductase
MILAATSLGLGTCWICAFDRAAMDAALGVSAPWRSFAITPVGYPDGEPAKIAKKSINSLFLEIK